MKTTAELKQEFVDYIATLDKANMSLVELSAYADLVRKADDLFKPSYAEMMANGISLFPTFPTGFATERRGK